MPRGVYLLAALLVLAPTARAQAPGYDPYLTMAWSVSEQFGRTWQAAKACGVELDGLSRSSAQLLFHRRMGEADLAQILAAYDSAVHAGAADSCDRRRLDDYITRSDTMRRRYLQSLPPLRIEFPARPARQF